MLRGMERLQKTDGLTDHGAATPWLDRIRLALLAGMLVAR
jgi:hypothetical protein